MPYHEFRCDAGHVTEKLFKTFAAAVGIDTIDCRVCGAPAPLIDSVPASAQFFGEGWYKPSPQKRYNTKLATQKGNDYKPGK